MFGKVTANSIHNTLRNIKSHLGNAYHHAKHVGMHINHGFHVAKSVYRAIEPALRELAPAHADTLHGHVMHAVSGYDNIRNKVLDVNNTVSNVGHKLGKLF